MDTVTQITLGAAVGEAVLGRKVGNRALLWGGIIGTLPDLDVFVPLGDVVKDFTYHRSASHSLLVLALVTPLLVWLIMRIHPQTREYRARWALLVYLCFVTHVLLDCFTAYGTQILWPVIDTPVFWSTIFIIDPLYTLPLLVGVIAALILSRERERGHRLNRIGLILSSLYLCWTVVASGIAQRDFRESLRVQNIEYQQIFVTPGPFTSLLWRAVVMDAGGYYHGYYSILDDADDINFVHYPDEPQLLAGLEDHWPVQRLQWFSQGFYSVNRLDDDVVISDLRMGVEPNYVFRFKVGEISNPHPRPTTAEQLVPVRDLSQLPRFWARIWDPSIQLSPPPSR